MKPSAPLSPAAREVLDRGSIVEPPNAEQCERMDRALARLLAMDRMAPQPAAPPRLGVQRAAPRAHGLMRRAGSSITSAWRPAHPLFGSSLGKLGLALGALVVTASVSFWMGRVSAPPDAAPVAPGTVAAFTAPFSASTSGEIESGAPGRVPADPKAPPNDTAEPAAVESTAVEPTAVEPAAVEPAAVKAAPARVAAAALPVLSLPDARRARQLGAPSAGLAAEIERLARAEAALRQGRSSSALSELELPAAHLVEQAAALRAIANCELGRGAAVLGAGEALRRWPGSAFAPRIRAACGL